MLTEQPDFDTLLTTDARCRVLFNGLSQLSPRELERVHVALVDRPDTVLVDSYNFNPVTRAWCPLAIGLDVPTISLARRDIRSNAEGKRLILEVGRRKHASFSLNPISGVPGTYFQANRLADLTCLVEYLLPRQESVSLPASSVER